MLLKEMYYNKHEEEPTFILENGENKILVAIEEDGYMFVTYLTNNLEMSAYVEYLAASFVEEMQKHITTKLLIKKYINT